LFGATGGLALLLALGLAATGPGVSAWLAWTFSLFAEPRSSLHFVFLTVFSTVLAFHWMNVYQPRVPASRAALIYLLEPIFAALLSLGVGYDQLSQRLIVGGGLIIGGNLIVELPSWVGRWRNRRSCQLLRTD
jgi:drug/metabolite transporter (DMT)-like permease